MTSSAARAKITALKRAVADAESFLGSEEGRGLDNIILKKLEIFKRTLTAQVERTERMQGRMGLSPAEQEELEDWLACGHRAVLEISAR